MVLDYTVLSMVLIQYAGYEAGYVVLPYVMVLNSLMQVLFGNGLVFCYAK